ncbi:MAG: histidine kinase [Myxococcota bacterium]
MSAPSPGPAARDERLNDEPPEPRWLGRHWYVHVLFLLVMQWLFYVRVVWMVGESELRPGAGPLFTASLALLVACAALLARAYRALPPRWLSSARTIVPATMLPALAALLWHGAMMLFLSAFDGKPLRWRWILVIDGVAMLVSWSCFFLSSLQSQRAQRAREWALRSESVAHEARLEALRAQLNPHFLFNALNSVVVLIGRDPMRAGQLVRDLASLLRRVLESTQSEMSTVGAELDFLDRYIRCESVRFEERLQVDVRVPVELRAQPIPPMLLQPLVENAMKHGSWREDRLRVELSGRAPEGRVELELRNTGSMGARGGGRPKGAGLRLVRQRLHATFPASARFEVAEDGGWVVARLSYDPMERRLIA